MGGAGGGLSGPAAGMYPRLAKQLVVEGVDSLRLDYRRPNHLSACVLDTLIGAAYLQKLGYRRLVLVGHSFGGAVVITAGAQLSGVVGIVCLASQNAGTELAHELSPRAILLLHGEADGVLNAYCSQDIYMRSREPRQLILYPGCGHGFDECRNEADRDILRWIREQVQRTNPT
ncbi:MAG: alpha/beta hydrolase [Chloroflexi bacterium]|nr:MAG: alpha/beta hydrolase [Chloroflexota bacterium]